MVKKKRHLSYDCASVKLFRDDLEAIFQIISETCKDTKMESGEYEYDSLDELESHAGREVRDLKIRGYLPTGLTLHLRRDLGPDLWASGETAEAPFLRIKDLLSQRKRLIGKLPKPGFWFVLSVIYVPLAILLRLPTLWYLVGYFPFLLLLGISGIAHHTGYFSSISLSRKHERKSFWSRNKDRIIVGIICALAGVLATWALIKLPASLGN